MLKQKQFLLAQLEHARKRVKDLSRRSGDIKSRLVPALKQLWLPKRQLLW